MRAVADAPPSVELIGTALDFFFFFRPHLVPFVRPRRSRWGVLPIGAKEMSPMKGIGKMGWAVALTCAAVAAADTALASHTGGFSIPFPAGKSSPFTAQTQPANPNETQGSQVQVTWGPCIDDPNGNPLGQISISGVVNGRNIVKTRDNSNLGRAQVLVPWFTFNNVNFAFQVTLDDGSTATLSFFMNMYFTADHTSVFEEVGAVIDAGGNERPLLVRTGNNPSSGQK